MKILKSIFISISLLATSVVMAHHETSKNENIQYKNIGNQQLEEMINKKVILIDIRRPEEWKQTGVVKTSKLITLYNKDGTINKNFEEKFLKAVATIKTPFIFICRTGNRTQTASSELSRLGYENVFNVEKGITDWIKEKRPTYKVK